MNETQLLNRKQRIEKQFREPFVSSKLSKDAIRHINRAHKKYELGKAKDFFEITPEMVAYLDVYLGRDLIRFTKEAQHIFKLDNNQGYMLLMTWANDRFRKYGNPTVNNLLPITHLP